VLNTLVRTRALDRNSNRYGQLFEHWVLMELRAFLSYRRIKEPIRFWRTDDKIEVDFVLGDELAIEVKSSKKISKGDISALKILQDEAKVKRYLLVSHDPVDRVHDKIELLHWRTFVERLWEGRLIW